MNIMFASHTYMGGPFVVGSHHLAREMEKLGHAVLHVSTPITPFHLLKLSNPDYRERFRILTGRSKNASPRLINSVPLSWFTWKMAGPIFQRTGKNWMVPSVKQLLRKNGMEQVDILFIDQPSFVGLEKLVKPKVTVYRPTDLYSKLTGNPSIAAAEAAILADAQALVSTSSPVLEELQGYNPQIPTLLLENGVEFEHFASCADEPEELRNIPHPRATYVGALDERLDREALLRLAQEQPETSVVIIGPHTPEDEAYFSGCSNAYLLGAKPYARMPDFLHHSDLALLPLSDHSANRGRSPMKLYEYAAAGLPVVVTETPELLRRQEDFLHFYRDSGDFPGKVRQALALQQDKERVRSLARSHAWDAKATRLLDFVSSL
ncbi:glycosyltransferase family protein [Paenibacillus daejeonensis]|uniref:glycosyltransferase family protein n=1 Tax=Paenibacillus daejeonensis TaxID=135193 RepID=UPI0003706719|nr:glycosyltransferase [Paenibacillus daejeonensis]